MGWGHVFFHLDNLGHHVDCGHSKRVTCQKANTGERVTNTFLPLFEASQLIRQTCGRSGWLVSVGLIE
jgi:hypothetical protein